MASVERERERGIRALVRVSVEMMNREYFGFFFIYKNKQIKE